MKEKPSKMVGRVIFLSLIAMLLNFSPVLGADATVFTKYNIHTQVKGRSCKASYANYTNPGAGHLIIPAGSEITVLKKGRKSFRFRVESDNRVVDFEFHAPRMEMSVDEYLEKVTSPEPVSWGSLSDIDQKGIADGKGYAGMTRTGVMAALGYPATHRTPNLDAATWVYWKNRFGTLAVNFDENGRVREIRD